MGSRTPVTSCYLAELYGSPHRPEHLTDESAQIVQAVEDATASGVRIRYRHSVLVPDEETVFHVFEAESPEAVESVLRAAGLEAERISAASTVTAAGLEPVR